MTKENMKKEILRNIGEMRGDLVDLCRRIHDNPETCFNEVRAHGWLTEMLVREGFEMETPLGGLETAFRASFHGRSEGPRVAFLAEYDALPEVGHGCGHNVIATSAVGAAIGLSRIMKELDGDIVVMGTPAEEGGGGKVLLIREGAFDDIDFAMMMHPSRSSIIGRRALASTRMTVKFHGRAAHSAGPERGINALQALLEVFRGIDSMRGTLRDQTRINGIITDGGHAANTIPDFAEAHFSVRAATGEYLNFVIGRISDAVRAAEELTGARGEVSSGVVYEERYPNMIMAEAFRSNMGSLGEEMGYPPADAILGSSDIGNVSRRLPTIHPYLKITGKDTNSHTNEFAEAAASERAMEVAVKGAMGLAMTGLDILVDGDLRRRIVDEFDRTVPDAARPDLVTVK